MKLRTILLSTVIFVQLAFSADMSLNHECTSLILRYNEVADNKFCDLEKYSILSESESYLQKIDVSCDAGNLVYAYDNLCQTFNLPENNDQVISYSTLKNMQDLLLEKIAEEKAYLVSQNKRLQNKVSVYSNLAKLTAVAGLVYLTYKNKDLLKQKASDLKNYIANTKAFANATKISLDAFNSAQKAALDLRNHANNLVHKASGKITDFCVPQITI